ncbi:MAG: hypothetical protein Kow0077_07300 [Anaerolineae bacterium]
MTQSSENVARCLVCEQTSDQVPLLTFAYQGGEFAICPQHLPILIHKPAQLAGKLPNANALSASDHHDH